MCSARLPVPGDHGVRRPASRPCTSGGASSLAQPAPRPLPGGVLILEDGGSHVADGDDALAARRLYPRPGNAGCRRLARSAVGIHNAGIESCPPAAHRCPWQRTPRKSRIAGHEPARPCNCLEYRKTSARDARRPGPSARAGAERRTPQPLRRDDIDAFLAPLAPRRTGNVHPRRRHPRACRRGCRPHPEPGSDLLLDYRGLRERYLPETELYGCHRAPQQPVRPAHRSPRGTRDSAAHTHAHPSPASRTEIIYRGVAPSP